MLGFGYLTKRHLRALHKAICSLDGAEIKRLSPWAKYMSSDLTFWAGVHKARTQLGIATPEQKAESAEWLRAHGFKPFYSTSKPEYDA